MCCETFSITNRGFPAIRNARYLVIGDSKSSPVPVYDSKSYPMTRRLINHATVDRITIKKKKKKKKKKKMKI
jgi:hypothetical protein